MLSKFINLLSEKSKYRFYINIELFKLLIASFIWNKLLDAAEIFKYFNYFKC